MLTVADFLRWTQDFAPERLAADWDNIGLLIGDRSRPVARVMTCLTVTSETVNEAIRRQADLILTHHPFPFSPTKRITADHHTGRLLLSLIEARIAVISPHTAFDSALRGINQMLGQRLGLQHLAPLIPDAHDARLGTGRFGRLATPVTLEEFAQQIAGVLGISNWQTVGNQHQVVERVAIGCGSAGELLGAAQTAECDCFVTGEARFHTALDVQAAGMSMLLLGHYASERFAVEELVVMLKDNFPQTEIWPSQDEHDPIEWGSRNTFQINEPD